MADENTLASSSTSHIPSKKTPLDVATILNELTLDESWTPDETPIDLPAPSQPQRKASATEIFNKRRPSLPLSASHTHSIHADIPSPVVEHSPGFVDISLDAWSDSTPAPQHHSSPAALSISSSRTNPSTSNPFNNSFATSAFPASTFSTRRSSATSPTNPWAGTSPVNKGSIADHSEVLGPFVNVSADSSDGSPSLSVATSPQNGTSHSAQVKRSLSVGNFDSIAESESGTNIRQRATSSNSVFGWLSKSPKVARPSKTRPTTLPPKDPKEEEKHLREYHQLQQAAQMLQKKREARHREEREARESYMHNSVNLWETEIIPFWMAQSSFPFTSSSASPARLKNSKRFSISGRTRNLWHQGLPPKCRGTVWCLGIGNEVGVTKEMFDLCVIKARKISILNGKRESDGSIDSARGGDGGTLNQGYLDMTHRISMDISRTFPSLKLFQPGAPYYTKLTELLETYICWGHDLGYVEGMSFIAAILLINMEAMPAFVCFVNLLRRPLHLAFFRMDMDQMDGYFQVFKELFVQQLPMLYVHFQKIGIQPDLYIYDWFLTVFSQTLSLELATKMWYLQFGRLIFAVILKKGRTEIRLFDKRFTPKTSPSCRDLFLCDGSSFLFRAGVALLASVEARLYGDFDEVLYTLSHITTVDPPVTEVLLMRNLNDIKLDEKEFLELCTRHQCLP